MDFVMGIFVGMGIGAFLVTTAYLLLATRTTKKRDDKDREYLEVLKQNEIHFSAIAKTADESQRKLGRCGLAK